MDDAFHYETSVQVRFRDRDPMGQVHNAVFLVYVEEARVRYVRDVLDVGLQETHGAVARQTIDYHAPIDVESAVTVRYRVDEIGSSSLTMAFEVVGDDGLAASGEVVHVVLDEAGDPSPVPAAWVERIRAFEGGGG